MGNPLYCKAISEQIAILLQNFREQTFKELRQHALVNNINIVANLVKR